MAAARSASKRPTALLVALVVLVGASAIWMLTVGGGVVTPSSDDGAGSVSVVWLWAAALAAILVLWGSSRSVQASTVETLDAPRLTREIVLLLGCAVAFPLLMLLPVWHPLDYVGVKVVVLLLIPGIVLAVWARGRREPSVRATRPELDWLANLGVVVAIAGYLYLTQLSPIAPRPDGWSDLVTLIVAATATALTASIGEEIFYRYWLQTRLEARLGRWPGLLATSVVFGMMHLASHGRSDDLVTGIATILVVQGVFGFVAGYLWSRYRRLWMPIVLHLGVNGVLVVAHLISRLG